MAAHIRSNDGSNPFLAHNGDSSPFAPAFAPAEPVQSREAYAMIPCAPAVEAKEVETEAFAVEVIARWSDNILYTGHLSPVRPFSVGEENCDIVVPAERLGAARAELLTVEGGEAYAVVPRGTSAQITIAGRSMPLASAITDKLVAALDRGDDVLVRLAQGTRITLDRAGLSFELAGVLAGRKITGGGRKDKTALGLFGLSLGVHGAIAAAMLLFMPALSATEEGSLDDDQRYTLMRALAAVSEKELEAQKNPESPEVAKSEQQGGSGQASKGESGKMGKDSLKNKNAAYAVSGGGERMLSREAAYKDAQDFGMVGILASLEAKNANAPTAPWGAVATGPDALTADGNMWGSELGDAGGASGLNLTGVGEGGGGKGWGVGMGPLGTVAHGGGNCADAHCQGFGNSSSRLPGTHKPQDIKVRVASVSVSGRMPPEVIQRVVRQNHGRFRGCYEAGLRNNPNLQGRVLVAFTIGSDGAIGSAQNGGSDLPDSAVVSCVVRAFYGLSFPAPEGGVVRVSYPISFSAD